MSEVVLLTGATGFIGTQVAMDLLKRPELKLTVLVRAENGKDAERRARRQWWDHPSISGMIGRRITVVAGDVSKDLLGLVSGDYETLVKTLTHIIHAAAEVRLDVPAERLRLTNIQGTANVVALAREAHQDHGLSRFSHLSTAYVAGKRTGEVPEDELTDRYGFSSDYERSKFESEKLVRGAGRELPISIFRPGMVVGDSETGYVRNFNTLYVPVRFFLTKHLRVLPVRASMRVNFVPVDYVAGAVVSLSFDSRAEGGTFHLTAPSDRLPTASELVALVREWALEKAGLSLPRPFFLPISSLARRSEGALGILSPYFNESRSFLREGTDRLLGPYSLDWKALVPRLLDFALYNGFLHRSARTVHEQILFRLESRSRPVRCFDIVEGKNVERPATDLRREMMEAAAALREMGIRPGDRVAIVGPNSTRYLALDVAIGLAGAVSVPLYYTSPPAEIDGIVRLSGAKLLLVGAPNLFERLGALASSVATVSFCRGPVPKNLANSVTCWEDFLGKGKREAHLSETPVAPDDLATLRFTSGTTGFPKGVEFTHRGIRWMGEAVSSIFPFDVRSRDIRYLSFLPMNHVVEGILSTYAPFYEPATLSIYFLEDFRRLANALPAVRPSIFFSVPRVYEKLWSGLCESPAGRRYLSSRGMMRSILRGILRRGLLGRAGLDRCAQLIAGSALVSEELLSNLRELGIEVHDAYGLTEAPLVALNRLGANKIGTVGQPLPETDIKIAEDGEILVRGPQVTRGYFGENEQPFMDGWLMTGDLGRLEAGYLVIEGRKKELLATSYGKKIQPQKIETMLRAIAGVAEAMVVAEGRPYCAAVLWTGEGAQVETLDAQVGKVNSRLSHPEQIKRWAALGNDLTIESGELTANLKLRRREVEKRRSALVSALYGEGAPPQEVLRMGGSGREK
jgi:long-chain acyl-CoA synthetase